MNWKEVRKRMDAALKAEVVPLLKSMNFKGSYPHFRRTDSDRIDVIGFQFSQWGPQFYVEVAVAPLDGVTLSDGRHFPPEKVKYYQCWPRHRVGENPFNFENGNIEDAARRVKDALSEAEDWWQSARPRRNSQPGEGDNSE